MPELLERFDMANSCATILCMRSPDFEKRASGRSLLVVEDDADIREALDGLLSMEGFRVAGCSNGREALDWLRASPKPDIILLDLMMPIMDGWQFRVAQKDDPELATIPVLALSADSTAKAAAIDAEAYLKKPVDYDTLIATIDRLLVESEHREIQARLAQTDRLTSLGTLAVGVAHEINNPLAYVLLNLGYVAEELPKLLSLPLRTEGVASVPDDPPAESAASSASLSRAREVLLALDHARDGAERIRNTVRSLQTFSRPENEMRAPLQLSRLLDATLPMVANEIRHRARLVKQYEPVPDVVANEARLGQVFLNLLLNAVQALPEEHAESNEIQLLLRAPSPDRVCVEVRDNGIGIPPQIRGRIFEPFFTTKPVGIGTGLGLTICHGIVTSLGGTLSFDSEVGKGSTFRVELPAAVRTMGATAVARVSSETPVTPSPSPRGRILVVDDEPIVCFSLERLLSTEGEVVALTSARQALAIIRGGERFDVILCDLMMPEMDAPVLYEELRRIAPTQAERMVFVTGGAFTVRAREFLESVPNPRLVKPFDVEALVELVRSRIREPAQS
ncbi:MAG TPA: response regulator [Polyangiaceae bacterium]|jgi:two-component system, cell cycle sensor histidine kinase and response regulator CckA|nr:response regulator [Polyangiaceae bacterium]